MATVNLCLSVYRIDRIYHSVRGFLVNGVKLFSDFKIRWHFDSVRPLRPKRHTSLNQLTFLPLPNEDKQYNFQIKQNLLFQRVRGRNPILQASSSYHRLKTAIFTQNPSKIRNT
ncbi:hypothetical protein L596_000297 [Steinernema carpocapsae]|uniref:Uncharacterized protein n=1 Tax=Steinernema carpocapsae TaxID=34508 RepID=A0A4U8UJY6_STECR|nr:hypothetical protein L596_000297 [Steinernema carpocapsae]